MVKHVGAGIQAAGRVGITAITGHAHGVFARDSVFQGLVVRLSGHASESIAFRVRITTVSCGANSRGAQKREHASLGMEGTLRTGIRPANRVGNATIGLRACGEHRASDGGHGIFRVNRTYRQGTPVGRAFLVDVTTIRTTANSGGAVQTCHVYLVVVKRVQRCASIRATLDDRIATFWVRTGHKLAGNGVGIRLQKRADTFVGTARARRIAAFIRRARSHVANNRLRVTLDKRHGGSGASVSVTFLVRIAAVGSDASVKLAD